ncbi:MAG TPA: NAD(P)H-hydrate dehydratase [Anaerolineae bacterium]|nr:NAD(P)H-hydrate dehydratase [Anaerolineae bacterium]
MNPKMPILSVIAMREWETAAVAAGYSFERMMELAGQGVARAILRQGSVKGRRVLALIGPGNNGGDGLVAARYLAEAGAQVTAYLVTPRDAETDAVFQRAVKRGVTVITHDADPEGAELRRAVVQADLLMDALLGTGARPPLRAPLAALLQEVRAALASGNDRQPLTSLVEPPPVTAPRPLIIAVDGPSGMDFDTGEADPLTLKAHLSVTFAAPKTGHFRFPAAGLRGELVIADIGIPETVPAPVAWGQVLTAEEVRAWLPARPANAHKGTFGRALIVAGSVNYTGAAALAALAAVRSGAGLVTLGIPGPLHDAVVPLVPEATYVLLPSALGAVTADAVSVLEEALPHAGALLIGPGLGQAPETIAFIQQLFEARSERRQAGFAVRVPPTNARTNSPLALPPLIVDADGLNILSRLQDWAQRLPAGTILTPHPGEMARLTGEDTAALQADRQETARRYAAAWGHVVLLKGAFTVVAAPDGRAVLLPFANPGLASAGTGDVLAGVIVALRAQGLGAFEAAGAGAYLHGLAGELAREQFGAAGMAAGDVARALPEAFRRLESQ